MSIINLNIFNMGLFCHHITGVLTCSDNTDIRGGGGGSNQYYIPDKSFKKFGVAVLVG